MTNDIATETGTGEREDGFEDYLKECFMEDEPESVGNKDTFDDNFDNWLNQLDADEWMKYGDQFKRLNK